MKTATVSTLESSILDKAAKTLKKINPRGGLFDMPQLFHSYIETFKKNKDLLELLGGLNGLSEGEGSASIDPITEFWDFCLAKCKQDFSSTLAQLSQSNQQGNKRNLSQLLGKVIQLGTLDFKYTQEMVSKFDSVEYVYIDQPRDRHTIGYVPSIYHAAQLGLFRIIPSLAKKGANPNARYDGETCLHQLIELDNKDILNKIDILICVGAKTNIKSMCGLTPVEKAIFFNKDQIVQHFKEKGYTPSWKSTLGISSLKLLYNRIEAYIVTEYLNFKKSGKIQFIISAGEMHGQPDSLITMMMITNICHRLGIETYYFETKNIRTSIPNKTALESTKLMSPRIAQEYGMKVINIDLAKTDSSADCKEKGRQERDDAMANNVIKSRKSGMLHIGAAHLQGVGSLLSGSPNIYHCNVNTCFGLRQWQKEKSIGFMYDERECFQAYLLSSVTDSEEIMLLMQGLVASDLKGKKLIPLLEAKGIFKKTSLKDVHLETKKKTPLISTESKGIQSAIVTPHFFHAHKENEMPPEIKKFRRYFEEIKAEYKQEQKENNTSTHLKNLLFPEISRSKKLSIAKEIDKALTKHGNNIEQAQAEIDQIIQNNLESVEDRWGRMNGIMQDLSANYRRYKHNKSQFIEEVKNGIVVPLPFFLPG